MNAFGAALKDLISTHFEGNQAAFARQFNINTSLLSRYISKDVTIGLDTLNRICLAYDEATKVALVTGYLLDNVPDSARELMEIRSRANWQAAETSIPMLEGFDAETRSCIAYILERAKRNHAGENALRALARALGWQPAQGIRYSDPAPGIKALDAAAVVRAGAAAARENPHAPGGSASAARPRSAVSPPGSSPRSKQQNREPK